MALGKNLATGRADAAQTPIMKRIRKPKFVDNGIRHGEYVKQQGGFTVSSPTKEDFVPTHDRRYSLIEEEDTVRLVHKVTDGHRYQGSVFFDDARVQADEFDDALSIIYPPPLLIGANDPSQSLVLSEIIDPSVAAIDGRTNILGSTFRLDNMKGRELKEIGFTDKDVRIGQKVNVGLRTTDLVSRVAKASTNSLNGLTINNPSATFVARDLYGIDAVTAMRFLSKHDGYNVSNDQFGNLHYSHQMKHNREHYVTQAMVTEGSVKNSSESVPNRVVVRGKPRANNDKNVIQIDDFGPQGSGVNEVPGGIYSPTAVTKASAKAIGRRFLSMAKRATGGEKLMGVVNSTNVQPGDVISYDEITGEQRKIDLSTKHDLINGKSEIEINAVSGSLEDILQRFQEVDISSSEADNEDRNRQYSREEFFTSLGFKIKVSWRVQERAIINKTKGMAIGIPNKSTITGGRHLKVTGILINQASAPTGYAIGTTTFATDGVNADSVYTSGIISAGKADAFVYKANGNLLGKVQSATANQIVLTKKSPYAVEDNEELFLISVDTLPESYNTHLTIGLNKGTMSSRRRG